MSTKSSEPLIRVGIVGTSWWADSMYLPALASHPHALTSAICGRNAAIAQTRADLWGIGRVFSNWKEMLDSGEIDAVIVASSNQTHEPVTRHALSRGLHVLCEKPLALSAQQAAAMATEAAQSGLTTMVPFTYHYMPVFAATKQLIEQGFLGTPHHLNLRYFTEYALDSAYSWRFDKELAGSGVIGDLGSHWLFCAEWLLGPIAELGCVSAVFVDRDLRPDGSNYQRNEDSAVLSVRFANGALGTLQVCAVSWEGSPFGQTHHLDAHGSEGTIYAACDWDTKQEVRVLSRGDRGPSRPIDLSALWPQVRFDTVHNTYRDIFRTTDVMARRWISDIAAQRLSTPDLSVGARVQQLTDLAVASAAQDGRLISVPPTLGVEP